MKRASDLVHGSTQQNPFSDSQARNFSDTKLLSEFFPISNYWSLFNDQHEILLGTRGSGKTFLLKMMRYSMLKRIKTKQAKQLSERKEYIALYVPMHLEFVTHLTSTDSSEESQIQLFQFAFNCLLAQSLLVELKEILSEESDAMKRARINMDLSLALNSVWFNDDASDVSDLFSLTTKLEKLFYNFDVTSRDISYVPPVFKRLIGASLLAVKGMISNYLDFPEDPTWIICIDEAEFLSEPQLRCINSVFRSDSKRIALKVATLPYYHRTLKTLDPNISVSAGNDFSYRIVDMKYDDMDFLNLTNALVANRLKTRFDSTLDITKLEDFLGVCGDDAQIDYYQEEVGPENACYDIILKNIISELSNDRKKNIDSYPNQRKTIYDKFAPIFYVRSMYRLSREGNTKPGWYAGSQMVRKIAQGNPRAFIQIMNNLFEKARVSKLTPKAQHGVLVEYARMFCESTQALEGNGPTIYRELNIVAKTLHEHVHGPTIRSTGCNFILRFDSDQSFEYARKWLEQAIAYSRVIVGKDVLVNGITKETEFLLANTYAVKYWLPMRADISPKSIRINSDSVATYTVAMPTKRRSSSNQLSFFEEELE